MKSVNAYLSFDGNCREAISFYRECLATEAEVNPYPDASGQSSADPDARVMHAKLGRPVAPILMASDTPQAGSLTVGNNFSVAIDCDSVEEADRLFAALSRGGEIRMPLVDAPWGARFGMLTDRFGVQWMVNCYQPAR